MCVFVCSAGVRPKKCERMHDLRKEIREVRYLMEGVETLYVGNDDFQTTKNMLIKRQKVCIFAKE